MQVPLADKMNQIPLTTLRQGFPRSKQVHDSFLSQTIFCDSKKIFCDFSVRLELENLKNKMDLHFSI